MSEILLSQDSLANSMVISVLVAPNQLIELEIMSMIDLGTFQLETTDKNGQQTTSSTIP